MSPYSRSCTDSIEKVEEFFSPTLIPYDSSAFPFEELMRKHLNIPSLESAHKYYAVALEARNNDFCTELHRVMYRVEPEFYQLYRKFAAEVVKPFFGEDLVIQAKPSFRFQMPGSLGVRAWHSDSEMGHESSEINVWVPLTKLDASNSLWLESAPGKRNFAPLTASIGTAVMFRGAELRHGNVTSTASFTRVSFDFRVIPISAYVDRDDRSINTQARFAIGEYFDILP